jgi:hypothetical protein
MRGDARVYSVWLKSSFSLENGINESQRSLAIGDFTHDSLEVTKKAGRHVIQCCQTADILNEGQM